jgi:hypothetical protein
MIYTTKKMAHGIAFNRENIIAPSSLRLLGVIKAISTSDGSLVAIFSGVLRAAEDD